MTESRRELHAEIEQFMGELLDKMRFDLEMETEAGDDCFEIRLTGRDSELVLRNGARLLDALNDIANQVFFHPHRLRIEIDCDDYRLTRIIELELLARNAADKTRLSGEVFRFQPMPPAERRTIHLALANEEGVRTESDGHGPKRHVVVYPE